MVDTTSRCQLCEQVEHMHKTKELYGHMVCKKCYYSFAGRRYLAFFLDSITLCLLMVSVNLVIGMAVPNGGVSPSRNEVINRLLILLFFFKDGFSGHSLGKLLCGIMVIDETTGEPSGICASFKRNFPLFIPIVALLIGIQLRNGHRFGDEWSNTKVIWKKYADHPVFASTQRA